MGVFDGKTGYALGQSTAPASRGGDADCTGGAFVHLSKEEAVHSMSSFPRSSAKWGSLRALLVVRGEGDFRVRHGKVLFDSITPLGELSWSPQEVPASSWRL